MILPPLLNNAFIGKIVNYVTPADSVIYQVVTESIQVSYEEQSYNFTEESVDIVVKDEDQNLKIEEVLVENVSTYCDC